MQFKEEYKDLVNLGLMYGVDRFAAFKNLTTLSIQIDMNTKTCLNLENQVLLKELDLQLTFDDDVDDENAYRHLITCLMLSKNGLSTLKVSFTQEAKFKASTILLHNTFN